MDRFLCIFELVKPRKKQDLRRRELRLDAVGKLQPVHIRHLDVRHDNIRLKFLHHLQSLHSVVCISDHGKSEPRPINLLHDDLDHFFLIIH